MIVILAALPVSAAEYTITKNEWLYIPVSLPEGKAGGGDFYNLRFEPVAAGGSTEYVLEQEGVRVRSNAAGVYDFRLMINHVTKSSCAGVEVSEYSQDEIQLHVVD